MGVPAFSSLSANYPKAPRPVFFKSIGWDSLANDPNYANTCAIRMSVCLRLCGVEIGRSSAGMSALKGPLKNKSIEVRQDKLSQRLVTLWGQPEKFNASEAEAKIAGRDGVVSFWDIAGYNVGGALGGHIDIVDGTAEDSVFAGVYRRSISYSCGSSCYFPDSKKVWFWPSTAATS